MRRDGNGSRSLTARAIGSLVLVLLSAPALAAAQEPDPATQARLAEFRARHGEEWSLRLDPVSGRPRRLAGGAIPLVASVSLSEADEEVEIVLAARSVLSECAALLELQPADLRLVLDDRGPSRLPSAAGGLRVLAYDVAPQGVPVLGARVSLAIVRGNLIYVHVIGAAAVRESGRPELSDVEAVARALEIAGWTRDDAKRRPEALLAFLPDATFASHRLVYRVPLIRKDRPQRLVVVLDAGTGDVVSITDETVSACDPPAGGSLARVLGGVRDERATDPEELELLPYATVDGAVVGADGTFPASGIPVSGQLAGSAVRVDCSGCTSPVQPVAWSGADGDVTFGMGGADEAGNGASTPADRTVFFHVERARRLARRYLSLAYLDDALDVHTNYAASCNAYWDGSSLTFYRSGGGCGNTGEIRDVIAHEWGHGLDDNDGLPASALDVDAATGEAVADIASILRSRDSCVGESFHAAGGGPSDTCDGVRDADERAAGHRHGTLDAAEGATACRPSGFYRGPLGREGHCEGEIFGQAFWHLVRDLETGVSYDDGTPVAGAVGDADGAWELLERLFFTSRPLLASYAPSSMQSIGTSAYDAFLVADDEGDGIANGTPHAPAIFEAFAHHGMAEDPAAPPLGTPCTPPPDPVTTVTSMVDAGTGRPALQVDWSDVGAASYRVLRRERPTDAWIQLGDAHGAGAGSIVDRGVLPARTYRYRVVAEDASGCASAGASAASGTAGASLAIASLTIDDSVGGNGDGLLATGESADVRIAVTNVGGAVARAVVATLASSDPGLVVVSAGPLAYGDVAAGGTVPGPGTYRIRADPGVRRRVLLQLGCDSTDGCFRPEAQVEIATIDLELESHRIDDSGGDGDGLWEAGEPIDLSVTLHDAGLLPATAVSGTISFRGVPPTGVSITRAVATWPDVAGLGSEESVAPGFGLFADTTVPPRVSVPLQLDVTCAGAPSRAFSIDLDVGQFPQGQLERRLQNFWGGADAVTVVVLELDDDDGDGRVTRCDAADMLVMSIRQSPGRRVLVALSGSTGLPMWEVDDPCTNVSPFGALAGGDVDGDGENEIVTGGMTGFVCAVGPTGAVEWRSASPVQCDQVGIAGGNAQIEVQLADLDRDGTIEVVAGNTVLNGVDGSVKWEHALNTRSRVVVADLDGDGCLEVGNSSAAWHCDGTPWTPWGTGVPPSLWSPAAITDVDADGRPDIVSNPEPGIYVLDEHGRVKAARTDIPGLRGAQVPPCAGDLDGDGRAEVISGSNRVLHALRGTDLSTIWTSPIFDDSGAASCSLFDFDGDGRIEVVQRDEQFLRIFDGITGRVLWSAPCESGTAFELPTIADMDGDGIAEITMYDRALPGGTLPVYGSPAWSATRPVWNQEAYVPVRVTDTGSIVAEPAPSWTTPWRGFKMQDRACTCNGEPLIQASYPGCTGSTWCFTGSHPGARAPLVMTWDFGDGSPLVEGTATCHEYATRGDQVVTLWVKDRDGCVETTSKLLHVEEGPTAEIPDVPACKGRPWCATVIVTDGVAPFDVLWDFGDGSPRETGASVCHVFAGGTWNVTAFVRDANGCLAEASRALNVFDPSALPEVSPRGSAEPLLVRKVPGGLEVSHEVVPFPVNVDVGSLDDLHASGYCHQSIGQCALPGSTHVIASPAQDAYILVAASACESPTEEGPFGRNSLGLARPSVRSLGRVACP